MWTMVIIYFLLSTLISIHRATHPEEYRGRINIAFLIPLAVAAASAIYQGIKGAKQSRDAKKRQEEADAMNASNLADARRMALTGMPEAEYQRQLQNIYRNQSAALAGLRDRRSALAGAANIQQATNDALSNLGAQDAQMRRQAEQTALGQANRIAADKGQQAAYEREYGQALTGAALQNVFNTAGYGAMALSGSGSAAGTNNDNANLQSGMRPLNSSLYGTGGYKGGLRYSKPY